MRGVQYAGYILAQEGQQVTRPVTNGLKKEVAVLMCGLHSHDVFHGDPRIDYVLVLEGVLRWIDFRVFDFVTIKLSRRRDAEILYQSLGGFVGVASKEIDAYVNDPTVEHLLRVLAEVKV